MGWTGDSRAVLGRREPSGKCRALSLTHDHKPVNPAEATRIKAAGGRIERHVPRDPHSRRLLCMTLTHWTVCSRLWLSWYRSVVHLGRSA